MKLHLWLRNLRTCCLLVLFISIRSKRLKVNPLTDDDSTPPDSPDITIADKTRLIRDQDFEVSFNLCNLHRDFCFPNANFEHDHILALPLAPWPPHPSEKTSVFFLYSYTMCNALVCPISFSLGVGKKLVYALAFPSAMLEVNNAFILKRDKRWTCLAPMWIVRVVEERFYHFKEGSSLSRLSTKVGSLNN